MLSDNRKNSNQLKELIYTNVKPMGGTGAGKYSKYIQKSNKKKQSPSFFFFFFRVKVDSWDECVTQCCQFNRCNVAYWISSTCFHIECLSDELCQPIKGENSDINDETVYLKIRSVRK
jgi:hypothetical protein